MAKRTKKNVQIEHPEVLVPSIYSNIFGIGYSDTEVAINFGLSTPSYFEPHEDKDVPVARIFLSWEVAENLLNTLKAVIDEHKKPQKPKRKLRSKSGRGSAE
jgi:hypothetical protein